MENGHWYTDKNGHHYFVKDGESPKEGWERSKRSKTIDGGKYYGDEGDGKGRREMSKEEFDKFEADDEFDINTNDDFGFDEEDKFEREFPDDKEKEPHLIGPDGNRYDSEEDYRRSKKEEREIQKDTKDEQEAIEGYDKTLKAVDDPNTREQLEKIKAEEEAHEKYLKEAKTNPDAKYEDPDEKTKDFIREDGMIYVVDENGNKTGEVYTSDDDLDEINSSRKGLREVANEEKPAQGGDYEKYASSLKKGQGSVSKEYFDKMTEESAIRDIKEAFEKGGNAKMFQILKAYRHKFKTGRSLESILGGEDE